MSGFRCLALLAVICACGDPGSPRKPAEPTGRYTLSTINGKELPIVTATYLSGHHDELDHGSLRVLSRGHLFVAATIHRYNPDGSFDLAQDDTATFAYRRDGNIVVLTLEDPLGPRTDTLDMVTSPNVGLIVRSVHYIRSGWPAPMFRNALYVK